MTNKTMLERIDELMDALRRASNDTGVDACDKYGQPPEYIDIRTPYLPGQSVAPTGTQRYVRVPDPDEPLEAGQYRWCRVYGDGKWEPVAILKSPDCDHLVYYITGEGQYDDVEDCYEMGPVIRPPEGE